MRNFDERKAEIFRRSEKRMKERKTRNNRILTVCISLCLILSVLSITILSAVLPVGMDIAEQENELYGKSESENENENKNENKNGFVSVVITDVDKLGTQIETITDSDKVASIHFAILNLYKCANTENSIENSATQKNEIKDGTYGSEKLSPKTEYTISFATADGSEVKFVLKKNVLFNANNNDRIQLSEEQLEDLLKYLN